MLTKPANNTAVRPEALTIMLTISFLFLLIDLVLGFLTSRFAQN